MSNLRQFEEIAGILKRLLKEKGVTYRQLARDLKISESSVKKLFISKDCSYSRLNKICAIIGVELADVLKAAMENPLKTFRFTEKQERFLVENPKCFHVYVKLVFEEWSAGDLKEKFALSDASLFKYLRSLDQHNLIQLMPNGEVRCPDMTMVLLEDAGPIVDKIKNDWSKDLLRKVIGNSRTPNYHLSIRYFQLRPDTLSEFIKAVEELELEFGRRSVREFRLHKADTVPVSMMAALAPRSFVEEL